MIIKKFPAQFSMNAGSTTKQLNLMKGQIKRDLETAIAAIQQEMGPLMEQVEKVKQQNRLLEKDLVMKDERLLESEQRLKAKADELIRCRREN